MSSFSRNSRSLLAGLLFGFVGSGIITMLFGVAAIIGLVLFAFWLVWLLWTFVLGSVWPTGPVALVDPGYWLFVCEWVLLGLVGGRIFGGSKSK